MFKRVSLSYCRMAPNDDRVTFCTGEVLHRLQCLASFGDWINSIVNFGMSLHRMDLDISSLSCMSALTLVTREYTIHHLLLFLPLHLISTCMGSMYDAIRLSVARSYTSSTDIPFFLISSFTLPNHHIFIHPCTFIVVISL